MPLPVPGWSLFELGDPYFEADEVLGEFARRAYLNQSFYTRSVKLSLLLFYLLRAFSGYGVKIVHGIPLPDRSSEYYPLLREGV